MDDDQQMELLEELSTVKALVREMGKPLQDCQKIKDRIDAIHHDGLPAKYAECYWSMKEVFPVITEILNRPEVRAIMEGE